ncbi:pyroglutamyl-peptidase 1 [Leptopilina heterotoma]|uniref:pyroglutamyl-peptidase 1 n=1 Tax=Leptopilina heterotoma TaxID=63436 RepID=UPI001CA7B9F3|nr:pyroglutamyl-peptidase 1 [Leptopilina heterotoma]XP_043482099.1 pyroglutamyl-peptidase 1 [Leptopilina heterotoma]XP_043482100.1 pyroglutamyl-peptidase 1 [Leptopilina heterotoma]
MNNEKEKKILITGFGPFGKHAINASWEAVMELEKKSDELNKKYGIQLITENVPVAYDHVSKRIPELWKQHKPMFVLHLGVSHLAKCLTIECRACNKGYDRPDVNNKLLNDNENDEKTLKTTIDVDSLCSYVNNNSSNSGCTACISKEAGRYLCEYIFYNSLNIDSERALFIHVPDFNIYSTDRTVKGIYDIICHLIECQQNE